MAFDFEKYHRRSIRLQGYDYGANGAYFVTICTRNRDPLFGRIETGAMRLNEFGGMVHRVWTGLPRHYPSVGLDAFVIMPDHIHAVIVILTDRPVDGAIGAGLPRPCNHNPTLGNVVAYFKYQSTKSINAFRGMPGCRVWQRNYHEHIIRNQMEWNRIRAYIATNPERWDF